MLRWIANLFITPEYVTREELLTEVDDSLSKAIRAAANELYWNGKTDKFQQLNGHVQLLQGQLRTILAIGR